MPNFNPLSIRLVRPVLVSLLYLALAACGGTKILKEPLPMAIGQPIAEAADEQVTVSVDWVIVREGPGTWAKNADWDEYLVRVQNHSQDRLLIEDIGVFDSMLVRTSSGESRRGLVAGSRQTARRYADNDIQVKAGVGAGALLAAGAVGGAAAVSAGAAALYMSSAAAATTLGVLLAAPALVAGGVVKSLNQGRVDAEIISRQTVLPMFLEPGESRGLDLFFSLTPSPRKLRLEYQLNPDPQRYSLEIDFGNALQGLHLSTK